MVPRGRRRLWATITVIGAVLGLGARLAVADLSGGPGAPTITAELAGSTSVRVTWTPGDDSRIVGVAILRDHFRPVLLDADHDPLWIDTDAEPGRDHVYQVRYRLAGGALGPNSQEARVSVPGERNRQPTPPSTPEITGASTSATTVEIRWAPAHDDVGVHDYLIHRDYRYRSVVDATASLHFIDDHVTAGHLHRYEVRARDAEGTASAASHRVRLIVGDPSSIDGVPGLQPRAQDQAAPADEIAPLELDAPEPGPLPAPVALTLATWRDSVTLRWLQPADPAVVGWTVRRDGVPIAQIPLDSGSAHLDSGVNVGEPHSYAVSAIGADGAESATTPAATVVVGDSGSITGTRPEERPEGPGDPNGGPARPSVVSASTTTDRVDLEWVQPLDDPTPSGYLIHRDYEYLAHVGAQRRSFTDTDVRSGELRRYEVRSQLSDGTASVPSDRVKLTVGDPGSIQIGMP